MTGARLKVAGVDVASMGLQAPGCSTLAGVMGATRAGKGCGSCKLLVRQVVEWAADGAVEKRPAMPTARASAQ